MDIIEIEHVKHGKAICDDTQIDEFEGLGWKRLGAKPEEIKPEKKTTKKKAE